MCFGDIYGNQKGGGIELSTEVISCLVLSL